MFIGSHCHQCYKHKHEVIRKDTFLIAIEFDSDKTKRSERRITKGPAIPNEPESFTVIWLL